jgi:starvation-inducible outer membrane lipoprotein
MGKMINVRIEYKSGKVEIVEMNLRDYTKNLVTICDEGRLVSYRIEA